MIPAPTPAIKRLVTRIGSDGETIVSAVLAIARYPPFSAQRLAECTGDHNDRQIVVRAAVASSRLNRSPADFSERPAWTLSTSINTGSRKRLVPIMSCAPMTGSRRIRSRFREKRAISMSTLGKHTVSARSLT
jgi:hypothetical protein